MTKANNQATHRHALIGHKDGINNIEASSLAMTYDSPEESELFASYLKAVDLLTINNENRLKIIVKKLETEKDELIKALENRVANLEESHIMNTNKQVSALHEEGFSTNQIVKLLHMVDVFKSVDNGNLEKTLDKVFDICKRQSNALI